MRARVNSRSTFARAPQRAGARRARHRRACAAVPRPGPRHGLRRHHETGLIVDADLATARHVGRHQWTRAGRGFQQGTRQTFAIGRQAHNTGLRHRPPPCRADGPTIRPLPEATHASRSRASTAPGLADVMGADQREAHFGALRTHDGGRRHEFIHALVAQHACRQHHQRAVARRQRRGGKLGEVQPRPGDDAGASRRRAMPWARSRSRSSSVLRQHPGIVTPRDRAKQTDHHRLQQTRETGPRRKNIAEAGERQHRADRRAAAGARPARRAGWVSSDTRCTSFGASSRITPRKAHNRRTSRHG